MSQTNILLVEDNAINAKVVRIALELEGYDVSIAMDAEEATKMLQKRVPDLILMDLQLPGMSGLEFTKLLKMDPLYKFIPVVAITAFAMMCDEKLAIRAGCEAYFAKPVSMNILTAFIKTTLIATAKV